MTLIANDQATAVIHPVETALNFPALMLSGPGPDRASAPGLLAPPLNGGDGRFDATLAQLVLRS